MVEAFILVQVEATKVNKFLARAKNFILEKLIRLKST